MTAAAVQLLVDELGAVELVATDPGHCPACHLPTTPSRAGHPSYCPECTRFELGHGWRDNALRIEQGLGWAAYWRRVDDYGPPWTNPKAWTHSAQRQRTWSRRGGGARGVVHMGGATIDR